MRRGHRINICILSYDGTVPGVVDQLVDRSLRMREVRGSKPRYSRFLFISFCSHHPKSSRDFECRPGSKPRSSSSAFPFVSFRSCHPKASRAFDSFGLDLVRTFRRKFTMVSFCIPLFSSSSLAVSVCSFCCRVCP